MPPPLITHLYTADPSAHVFNGKVYIYPSHDRETDIKFNDDGDQYDMVDYHVFSLDSLDSLDPAETTTTSSSSSSPTKPTVVDHGVVLRLEDVPWASKQLWAPDAALNPTDGRYYLFFPARDRRGVFRIGVAVGDRPEGPFAPEDSYIPGTYSVDPAVLVVEEEDDDNDDDDDDGDRRSKSRSRSRGRSRSSSSSAYLYFGGLWGGQLQWYQEGYQDGEGEERPREPSGAGAYALGPRVARLSSDMRALASPVREVEILDPATGLRLAADDHDRRFFEAAWCHRRGARYYLSYSTGDTHYLCWSVGDGPEGPFTYGGRLLEPVLGWTTHHSVVEFPAGSDRWWLFYHDCELSGGVNHLRSVKVKEVWYDAEGRIVGERPS